MKILILYPFPLEPDGLSLQGHYLAKGLKELGVEVLSCDRRDRRGKTEAYKNFKPDFCIGIGYWGDIPHLVHHPQKFDINVIPWFNANGWVANYHNTLNSLPLVIATSNWVKSTYMRDGAKGDNIEVLSIGFNPLIFHPFQKDDPRIKKEREKLGIKEDEVMIFTAGGDVTSKGAQEMLRALAKVKSECPNWRYVLKVNPSFSSRDHGKEEKMLIKELGLQDKVKYLCGEMSPKRMARLINACDIYAAPARLEGFGMIQLEAQACGKPVISINVGGPKDVVVNNKTGFLVDVGYEVKLDREWVYPWMGFNKKMQIEFPVPKTFAYRADIDQLAASTLKLIQNTSLREKMGKAAAEHALENFHYQVIAKKMVKFLEKRYEKII
jgi:alpha-maltose-1-phosphate synthase